MNRLQLPGACQYELVIGYVSPGDRYRQAQARLAHIVLPQACEVVERRLGLQPSGAKQNQPAPAANKLDAMLHMANQSELGHAALQDVWFPGVMTLVRSHKGTLNARQVRPMPNCTRVAEIISRHVFVAPGARAFKITSGRVEYDENGTGSSFPTKDGPRGTISPIVSALLTPLEQQAANDQPGLEVIPVLPSGLHIGVLAYAALHRAADGDGYLETIHQVEPDELPNIPAVQ